VVCVRDTFERETKFVIRWWEIGCRSGHEGWHCLQIPPLLPLFFLVKDDVEIFGADFYTASAYCNCQMSQLTAISVQNGFFCEAVTLHNKPLSQSRPEIREIWDCLGFECQDCSLLVCNVVKFGRYATTFRRNLLLRLQTQKPVSPEIYYLISRMP
jgi:hypothetical protein